MEGGGGREKTTGDYQPIRSDSKTFQRVWRRPRAGVGDAAAASSVSPKSIGARKNQKLYAESGPKPDTAGGCCFN